MLTREDLQSFIDRLGTEVQAAEEVKPGLWVLRGGEAECVVDYNPPVVVLRIRVMELPAPGERQTGLFRRLLELNARELVHGSYGVEEDHVVLTDTLELEHLDFNEFQASFDSLMLALATHLGALAPFRER
jgi:hypothetical protein